MLNFDEISQSTAEIKTTSGFGKQAAAILEFRFLFRFWQILSLNLNPEVVFRLYGRHLEKSIGRHTSAADRPITTKFGKQMQNVMSITILSSKSKQETEFQYGGRLFAETGSSFFSAVDWDISLKFDITQSINQSIMQIDFKLLKQMLSLNLKPGIDFRIYGRHLENSIWCPQKFNFINSGPANVIGPWI